MGPNMSDQNEDLSHLFSFRSPDSLSKGNPALPPLWHQAYEISKLAGKIVVDSARSIAHLEVPKLSVSETEYRSRLEICRDCDHFRVSDERCGSPDAQKSWGCGCHISDYNTDIGFRIPGKARFRDAHCPLTPSKW